MLLSDVDLWDALSTGELEVSPMSRDRMQPASIEMHLADNFRAFTARRHVLDPLNLRMDHTYPCRNGPLTLAPGELVLGSTVERVSLSPRLAGRLEGKSSLGRLGLAPHVAAGFIDPGFSGTITLELVNMAQYSIRLTPGMPIGQLCVFRMQTPAERPYGHPELRSRYQGQQGTTPSYGVDQPKQ